VEWIVSISGDTKTILEHKYPVTNINSADFRLSDSKTLKDVFEPHTSTSNDLHFLMKKVDQPVSTVFV
jgi:hypothetical protein